MHNKIEGKGYGMTPRGVEDAMPNLKGTTSLSLSSKNKALVEGNPNTKVVVDNPFNAVCARNKKSF